MPETKGEMNCRLCHKKRPLRKSHIFPEFLYQDVYDEKHRYEVNNLAGQKVLPFRQSGIWEKLLCHDCEQKLSKNETYSSKVIRRLATVMIKEDEKNEAYILGTDVDYRKLKLFLLSLIWRAGVASKIPFDAIALGEHEENIRKLLVANDPGAPGCYPSVLQMFRAYRVEMRSAIMMPFKRVHEDVTAYRTYFLGFMCTTYMSSATQESRLQGVLRDNGDLPVKVMSEIQENACIREIALAFPAKDQEDEDV
jgi:hypothetical protein